MEDIQTRYIYIFYVIYYRDIVASQYVYNIFYKIDLAI